MANIKNELNNIKSALYGKDVRVSIHDGIDAINKEVENTTGRQVDLENTFDQLVINAGNSNAEIVDARVKSDGTSYSKLGDRLDVIDSQLAHNKDMIEKTNESLSYIDVKAMGVKTDGTDELDKIQEILNNHSNVMFKDGTFTIRACEGLQINNNQSILIHPNATIKVIDNDLERYYIFNIENKSNVKIHGGGTLQGDLPTHLGTTGEWGYCLRIIESNNITIDGLTLRDAWGDGMSTVLNTNIRIKNLIVDNCGRNGVSIASCQDFFGESWKISNIKRTFPKAGIDIEGESTNPHFKNLCLKNIKTENCGATGIDVYITDYLTDNDDVQIKIENHKDIGSPHGIRLSRSKLFGEAVTYRKKVNGFVELINPIYEKTLRGSIRITNWCEDSPLLKIIKPLIINCNDNGGYLANNYTSKTESSGIVSLFENGCVSTKNMGHIIVENPYIVDNRESSLMTNGIFVVDNREIPLSTRNFKIVNPIAITCHPSHCTVQIIGDKNIVDDYNFFVSDQEYHKYYITNECVPHLKISNDNAIGTRVAQMSNSMGNGDRFTLTFTNPNASKVAVDLNNLTDKTIYPLTKDSTSYLESRTVGSSITIKKENDKLYVVNMIGDWLWT